VLRIALARIIADRWPRLLQRQAFQRRALTIQRFCCSNFFSLASSTGSAAPRFSISSIRASFVALSASNAATHRERQWRARPAFAPEGAFIFVSIVMSFLVVLRVSQSSARRSPSRQKSKRAQLSPRPSSFSPFMFLLVRAL